MTRTKIRLLVYVKNMPQIHIGIGLIVKLNLQFKF